MAEKKTSPEWLVPDYPPLKYDDATGKAAVDGQLVSYPKVVRTMTDPPIPNQSLSLVSFSLFKEPRTLRNGVPVYGFVKIRGTCNDESQARFMGSKIVREVDSKYQVRIAPTGAWVPITDENAFVKDVQDVRMNDDELHLQDEAAKEKQAKQRQVMREIREREEEAKSGDVYDDPTSLTYYSMRRVTANRLMESRESVKTQMETINSTLRKVEKELKRLEVTHPEYEEEWVERYNVERRKGGLPDYVPNEDQISEYKSAVFESLDDSDEEDSKNLRYHEKIDLPSSDKGKKPDWGGV